MSLSIKPKSFLPDISWQAPVWLQEFLKGVKFKLEAVVLDPDTPAKPIGLRLSQIYTGVLLEWEVPGDQHRGQAVGYKIYRNTSNSLATALLVQEIKGLDNRRYFDGSVPATGAYYYWLSAVNAIYQEGQPTDSVKITTV